MSDARIGVVATARASLPTRFGLFEAHAFELRGGAVYLALVRGDLGDGRSVKVRVHSGCLTGDALGSVRCDCGPQLEAAMRMIAADGRGVIVYAKDHEGRGVGLLNKIRAYGEQDAGADTVDANVGLGLPVDARRYDDAAVVLGALGIRSIRLLTNNPRKLAGLRAAGVEVEVREPLPTAPHHRSLGYLRTKERRLGHIRPGGRAVPVLSSVSADVSTLLGEVRPLATRPYVVLKYAQTLDGRIATHTGDSRWISGEEERRISHALRASSDAVMVGVGTVLRDDPRLTVRHVAGASPMRVVLDPRLRLGLEAHVLGDDAPTVVLTTDRSDPCKRAGVRRTGSAVHVVPAGPEGLDLRAALGFLRGIGVRALLVEGGARVITSLLRDALADRLVVGLAPTVIGAGTEAVGDLHAAKIVDGLRLTRRVVHTAGDDLMLAFNIEPRIRDIGSA